MPNSKLYFKLENLLRLEINLKLEKQNTKTQKILNHTRNLFSDSKINFEPRNLYKKNKLENNLNLEIFLELRNFVLLEKSITLLIKF